MHAAAETRPARSLLIGLIGGLLGLGLNLLKLELFFNVDFLFGSIISMLVLQCFGGLAGITAALIASTATLLHWHHPWAVLIFTAEALAVYLLSTRRRFSFLNADILYWFTAGLLLVWLSYHHVMGFAPQATLVIALKQGVNGVLNTLLAKALCLTPWALRFQGRRQKPSLRELLFVCLTSLALIPALGFSWYDINRNFRQDLKQARENHARFTRIISQASIDGWFVQRQQQIAGLAAIMPEPDRTPPEQLQQLLERLRHNRDCICRQMVLDTHAITRAFVPKVDELGHSTLGLDLSNRPYMRRVMTPPYQVHVESFMGQIGTPGPRLAVIAPIHRQGTYQGAVLSVYQVDELQRLLHTLVGQRPLTVTLLNPAGQVVVSSDKTIQVLSTFALPPKGSLRQLDNGIAQWIPDPQPGVGAMKRWLRSFLYAEATLPSLPDWKLVTQWSLKPLLLQTNQQVSRTLGSIAIVLLAAIVVAHYFSSYLSQVFSRLEEMTRSLPQRLKQGEAIVWPSASVREVEGLTANFQQMAVTLQHQTMELQSLTDELAQRVRQGGQYMRTLVDNSPFLIWLKDTESRFLTVNRPLAEAAGCSSPDDLVGKSDYDVWPADLATAYVADDQDVLRTGIVKHVEEPVNDHGVRIWMETYKAPVFDQDGTLLGTVGFARDISEKKQAERLLREMVEAKMQFLANMSHEIRTPMNGVIGMVGLLQESGLNAEQQQYADVIRASGDLLLTIINDILDFSKIEAGRLDLEQSPFDLGQMLEELVVLLSPQAQQKSLQLNWSLEPPESCCLVGDATRLRQILMNLLSNALKFTEAGSVSLQATVDTVDDGTVLLRCQVRDTGIGIPEERLGSLFDPFTQVDSSTTRKYGGTGLGLAISRQLAQLMGGAITVASRVGAGTVFELSLPFSACTRDEQSALAYDRFTLPPSQEGAHARILLVEDNAVNQMVARKVLEKQGHTVAVAANGREALTMLQMIPVDLVLMDCQMPEMDGNEATVRIRNGEAGEQNRLVPIIAMTAHAFARDKERCSRAGMDDYLTKPVQPALLARIVALWRERRHGQAVPPEQPPEQTAADDHGLAVCFNQAELLSRLADDQELAESLVQIYLEGLDAALAELRQAFEEGDTVTLARCAHGLKGASLNSGAEIVAECAALIEKIATGGTLESVAGLLFELEQQTACYRQAVYQSGWLKDTRVNQGT